MLAQVTAKDIEEPSVRRTVNVHGVTFAARDRSQCGIDKAAMAASCLLTWPSIQFPYLLLSHRAAHL